MYLSTRLHPKATAAVLPEAATSMETIIITGQFIL